MKYEVPIWEKANLTLEEAAAYSGVGINKLRKISDSESCPLCFVDRLEKIAEEKEAGRVPGTSLFHLSKGL